jgi:signal transduction histidine kinase
LIGAVREALLNVEKHAKATAVVITVSKGIVMGRNAITVAVTDDGDGLSAGHTPGLGLTHTAEAIGRLGGTLRVSSDPSGGTLWRVAIPC